MKDDNSNNRIWIIILAVLLVLAVVALFIFISRSANSGPGSQGTAAEAGDQSAGATGAAGATDTAAGIGAAAQDGSASSSVNPEEVFGYDAEADDVHRIESGVADQQAPKNDKYDPQDQQGQKQSNTSNNGQQDSNAGKQGVGRYESPVDFRTLKTQNTDITAWLSVPGTNISYPVCWNEVDDAYYLNHNSDGKLDVNGALFVESAYNVNDFSDPVTVVYGHNMKSGKMFGYLEETFRDGLNGHDEAIIYMPNGEIHYKLFAALRVPSGHLLAGRNMYVPNVFKSFHKNIMGNKDLYSVIDHSVKINPGDRLLVMSTCVGGDPSQRYIVVGKRVSETSNNPNRRMDETD